MATYEGQYTFRRLYRTTTAMIYPKELAYYKRNNFPYPRGLQTFAAPRPLVTQLLRRMLHLCNDCVHGIAHTWESSSRRSVRLFWLCVVGMAIAGFISMYSMLASRHNAQVLITVVETSHLPIYSIPFPAVAVCPFNHVNWIRYQAAENKFLPRDANKNERRVFYDLLAVMEGITFTLLSPIGRFVRGTKIPPVIENLSLYDLAQYMAFRCDEVFVSCIYDETKFDCCKMFVAERTERGICLVFNSMISDESRIKKLTDNFYPWRVRTGGERSSLSFTLRYNKTFVRPGSKIPFAFSILIKEADEWSDSIFHLLYPNTDNRLMVTPIMIETSSNTRGIDPQKRKCLFSSEKSTIYKGIADLPYNKLNCEALCKESFVIKHCNCTMSMFFPGKTEIPSRQCQASDLKCIFEHRDVFNYFKAPQQDTYINDTRRGMVCDCVDNCRAVLFLIEMSTNMLSNASEHTPEIKTSVFYFDDTITKYVTRMEYTSMDLLANFGGILGLCLGASILNVAQVIYASIRTVFVLIVVKFNQKRRERRIQVIRNVDDTKIQYM